MFPLTSNEAYIKPTGERSTLGAELGGNSYTLPTASADTKGGVKIGSGLKMTGEVLSADQVPAHTIAEAGKVLTVADDGSLEWDTKGEGGGDWFLNCDFTKEGNRTAGNVTFSTNGATFQTANNSLITLLESHNGYYTDFTLYLDIAELIVSSTVSSHQRFIMGSNNAGLIYEYNNHVWGFYTGSAWEYTENSDNELFNDCTVKVYVDSSRKWHVYKNNILLFESDAAINTYGILIGSESNSIKTGTCRFTGARIYNGNYTE